ncbi:MAG TPA: amidohydrolase [Phycisphaerales bacterium]|nr:amidohydrolase [Phycisphaerales bacterium]
MSASLLIRNARIWTGATPWPDAHSVLVERGRIVQVNPPEGASAQHVLDLRGRFVSPGLIDAHLHMLMGGRSLSQLDLRHVRSRAGFEAEIAGRHATLPDGVWLLAHGWAAENWPVRDGAPTKEWLRAANDRPVVCYRMDLHAALVNDAVLQLCDLRSDPSGGRVERDARTGEPTGLMIEAAAWKLVNPIVPEAPIEMKRSQLREAQRHLLSLGITAVGSMEYTRDVREVYVPMREELVLRCAITLLDRAWPMDFSYGRDFAREHAVQDRLAVIGYKAFADGTLGSRTARLFEGYSDDPGNRGLLVELAHDGHLRDWAHAVAVAGLSPSIHAIGDEAARLALDATEAIDRSRRPRIEHAQQLDRADIARFAGRIASMQPLHKADDGRYAEARLGPHRIAGSFAFRQLLNADAVLAFGSDWPVVSCDPMLGMRSAITGLTLDGRPFRTDENLTVAETLRAYTTNAAFALNLDDAGLIKPGALADLVVFDCDPFEIDWSVRLPRVQKTIVNGEIVYDAEAGDP